MQACKLLPTFTRRRSTAARGLALLAAVTAALAGAGSVQAQDIRIGGTGAALGTMQLLAEAYAKSRPDSRPDSRISVMPSMGSGGGIKAMLNGAIQIAVSSRPLNEAELRAGAVETEYGRTPFVFVTPAASKATDITTQQLVDAYAGTLELWPDGSKIRLVLRPVGDSDSEMIKAMSAAMREAKSAAEQRKGLLFTVTDQETAGAIEKIPGGLGPSTLALLWSEKRALKALSLNGVTPDPKNLANGSYPLSKQMLFVTGPKTPAAALEFVAFVRTAAGRELLQQTGHWVK